MPPKVSLGSRGYLDQRHNALSAVRGGDDRLVSRNMPSFGVKEAVYRLAIHYQTDTDSCPDGDVRARCDSGVLVLLRMEIFEESRGIDVRVEGYRHSENVKSAIQIKEPPGILRSRRDVAKVFISWPRIDGAERGEPQRHEWLSFSQPLYNLHVLN